MQPTSRPSRSLVLTRIAWGIGAVLIGYIAAAYFIAPALWSRYEHRPGFAARPMVTTTAQGIPGDPINVGLEGSRREVVAAMTRAGWHPADPVTLKTSLEIGVDVVLQRPYADAPVSSLFYEGRRQDLAFEVAATRSPARRHHVRFWLTKERGTSGRELWLGSATFDRSVGLSHDTGQITHHIDPDVDRERDFLMHALADAGALSGISLAPGIGPTLRGRNGGGDPYYTDGDVMIGIVVAYPGPSTRPAGHALRPAPAHRDRLWSILIAAGRALHLLPRSAHDSG
ncbi:MAG TPA: LssY C-terminal domain-containing protein [Hyphomicrobiaceae bacterium]|jgi:hypothetical protein|nr:LssY C-terminal domain-containing protein [Hyphomicrobiaceae bacterium]